MEVQQGGRKLTITNVQPRPERATLNREARRFESCHPRLRGPGFENVWTGKEALPPRTGISLYFQSF